MDTIGKPQTVHPKPPTWAQILFCRIDASDAEAYIEPLPLFP